MNAVVQLKEQSFEHKQADGKLNAGLGIDDLIAWQHIDYRSSDLLFFYPKLHLLGRPLPSAMPSCSYEQLGG